MGISCLIILGGKKLTTEHTEFFSLISLPAAGGRQAGMVSRRTLIFS